MLYLTTKNKANSFTAHKVLRSAAAPDGGMFLPMQLPVQNDISLAAFEQMRFGETVATLMDTFFGVKLTGWDVDFAIGRQAIDLYSMGHKVSVAESWHNPAGSRDYLVQRLYNLAIGNKINTEVPNDWFKTVINIAILFGVYGKYCRRGVYEFDVAMETGDLQWLFAVRYAQKMGLPIRKVILGCIDGDGLWDFLSYGDFTASKKTRSVYFEALLWLEFGYTEVENYCNAAEKKSTYRLQTLRLDQFRKDIFAAVVGDHRAGNMVESNLQTNQYRMQTDTARAFAALLDYRAKTGENRNTLLFAQKG